MPQLTFKEYIQSKTKLYEAVEKTPKRTALYTIRKYCKLPVGTCKESKEYISLKPKEKLSVAWLYENLDEPTPININFNDVKDIDPDSEYAAFWNGARLLNWLMRNAQEETE